MLLSLVLAAASTADPSDLLAADMAQLFDDVCVQAFPDDRAVKAAMVARGARELTQEQVKVTMLDDPATAWKLPNSGPTVWLEFPPFHSCSVRWSSPKIGDLAPFQRIVGKLAEGTAPFVPTEVVEADEGDLHIHLVGQRRTLADRLVETLMVVDQHVIDPVRRSNGETGFSIRFVRQMVKSR